MEETNKQSEQFLFYKDEDFELYKGKMQDVLSTFEGNSIDSIVCDPPYELNFMSKGWDNQGIAFKKDTWEHCFRVLKEGGYLLAFGGTRTFHRIACAIEDAGFEIRDTIMFLYGSGFPKSMNIGLAIDKKNGVDNITGNIIKDGKATLGNIYNWSNGKDNTREYEERKAQNEWQGWGTCLKPAYEPIIVARKPFKGSLVDNVIENGVGGINIDECRVDATGEIIGRNNPNNPFSGIFHSNNTKGLDSTNINNGRFPANVITDGSEEVAQGMPNTKAKQTKGSDNRKNKGNSMFIDGVHNELNSYNDEGSAMRYFYCAKASKKDRDEGMDSFEEQYVLNTEINEETKNTIKTLLNQ